MFLRTEEVPIQKSGSSRCLSLLHALEESSTVQVQSSFILAYVESVGTVRSNAVQNRLRLLLFLITWQGKFFCFTRF